MNNEQGISNIEFFPQNLEGKFDIRYSVFDIHYSNKIIS